ncbi:MAG: hypothetical protein E4H08_09615 [Candidatus Atribacteria bacterium]|nr:MAG: hypothetical protein E4H08_09615 [Candidatus Atribacteria bacterium]
MKHWRGRYPYEWCFAVGGAVALAISPWVPSIPFSGLLETWLRWIGEPLLRWSLVAPTNGFLALFLPIFAAVLGFPLLAFCSLTLVNASRSLVWIVRTTVALMFLLAGMGTVAALIDLGAWFVFSQIAAGCSIGVLFLAFGVQLHIRRPVSSRIRSLAIILMGAGACMATFVLLPVGLLALCFAYLLLAITLASRQSEDFKQTS